MDDYAHYAKVSLCKSTPSLHDGQLAQLCYWSGWVAAREGTGSLFLQ